MHGFDESVDFVASPTTSPMVKWQRLKYGLLARRQMPPYEEIKPVFPAQDWTLLFLYAPEGSIDEAQRFTLNRIKKLDRRLLVVCAAPTPDTIPEEVKDTADALFWKGIAGYDFSAYAIGLHAIARQSEGADVFVLNDSIFGPFPGLSLLLERAKWELTGFTASAQIENHIQSYAFLLKNVTRDKLHYLRDIFSLSFAYNDIAPVIYCFETRFARVAAGRMTVGAFFSGWAAHDPSLTQAFALLERGLPFVKKSLLGKHKGFQDTERVRAALLDLGFPASALTSSSMRAD